MDKLESYNSSLVLIIHLICL